jgi:hypothetical protein
MGDEKRDPKALLEEAIRKRDELNTFIKVYQQMLGDPEAPAIEPSAVGKGLDVATNGNVDPLSVVYPGMFFGKSQPQAVRMLLEKMKPRPVKTRLIVEALAKGGAPVGGKKPTVNMWGTLNRNPEDFILVPKAGWGLVEWYDAAVIARFRKEGTEKENGENEKKEK